MREWPKIRFIICVRSSPNVCPKCLCRHCVFLETGVELPKSFTQPGYFLQPQEMVCLSLCLLPWAMDERKRTSAADTFNNTSAMLQLIHGSWTLHDTSRLFLGAEHVEEFSNLKNCVLILWKMSAPNQGFEKFSVGSHSVSRFGKFTKLFCFVVSFLSPVDENRSSNGNRYTLQEIIVWYWLV